MFGEGATKKSYAVLCLSEDETHISSVFEDAAKDGTSPAEFRVLDCNYVLPSSEKSIADRFKLNLKQRPTVFVSGHAGPPKQVPYECIMCFREQQNGVDQIETTTTTSLTLFLSYKHTHIYIYPLDSLQTLENGQNVSQVT